MVPLKEQAAGMDKNEVTNEPQSFVSDFLLFFKKISSFKKYEKLTTNIFKNTKIKKKLVY
jgi:hypothetical protein